MHDARRPAFGVARCRTFAGIGNTKGPAIGQHQLATVTRLSAALGVEHRAVEHHAAFVNGQNSGLALGQIGVIAKELFGHGALPALFNKTMPLGVCNWARKTVPGRL